MSGNGERYFSKRCGTETSPDVTVAIAVPGTTRMSALRWQLFSHGSSALLHRFVLGRSLVFAAKFSMSLGLIISMESAREGTRTPTDFSTRS